MLYIYICIMLNILAGLKCKKYHNFLTKFVSLSIIRKNKIMQNTQKGIHRKIDNIKLQF